MPTFEIALCIIAAVALVALLVWFYQRDVKREAELTEEQKKEEFDGRQV